MKKLALTLAALLLLTACGGNPTPTVQPTTQPPTASATVTPTGTATTETVEPSPEPTATQSQPTATPSPDNLAPPPTEDDLYLQRLWAMSQSELEAELKVVDEDGSTSFGTREDYLYSLITSLLWRKYEGDNETQYGRIENNNELLLMGETYQYDLDGDGKEDTFHVATHTTFGDAQDIYITVNGKCEPIIKTSDGRVCYEAYALVDIDNSDNNKELVFQTAQLSYDEEDVLHFFCYRNGAMQYMNTGCNQKRLGSATGSDNWIHGYLSSLIITGDGTADGTEQMSAGNNVRDFIIHYKLTKNHMLYDDADLYDILPRGLEDNGMEYTFAKPVIAYYDRNLSGKTTTILATSQCKFSRTDDEDWIEVTLKSGKKFWLNLYELVTPDGEELSLPSLFDVEFWAGSM